MINKTDNLSVNVKSNIGSLKQHKDKGIKEKEKKDEFINSAKLSNEDVLFLNQIMQSFAKRGHFDSMANDLLTKNCWSNGIDYIYIFYEKEQPKYVSVFGFTLVTGEKGITLTIDKFLKQMNIVKQGTIKKHPEKKEECQKLYSELSAKLKDKDENI